MGRIDQPISKALMVSFVVIIIQELMDRVPQRWLPEEDHTIQAAFLDGMHEPLGVSVQVRRPRRQSNHLYVRLLEQVPKRLGVSSIAIEVLRDADGNMRASINVTTGGPSVAIFDERETMIASLSIDPDTRELVAYGGRSGGTLAMRARASRRSRHGPRSRRRQDLSVLRCGPAML